jgi:hypothetical protein
MGERQAVKRIPSDGQAAVELLLAVHASPAMPPRWASSTVAPKAKAAVVLAGDHRPLASSYPAGAAETAPWLRSQVMTFSRCVPEELAASSGVPRA